MHRGIRIIGAGLAGSEAAWQAACRGIPVELTEMRPQRMTKAHRSGRCAELVCSNSFRGAALTNAVGLLKEELRAAGSLIMACADVARVPAGGAFAVDREVFSAEVDRRIRSHPLITFRTGEVTSIPESTRECPVVLATGPLTSPELARAIVELVGHGSLAFFDAISPIILGSSIDTAKVFRQSRYDKGEGADYLNVPLDEPSYSAFVAAVNAGEKFGGHADVENDFVADLRPFEGCMPIEEMAARGADVLRFGPLKPVGLTDPNTGRRPYAVVQLRQDNKAATLWSMVGMQTRLTHTEQQRIFRTLPGLEQAEFVRLGSVHRNTFIDSPKCLSAALDFKGRDGLFFAGQMTGVEGYVESTAGGLVAGINAARLARGEAALVFPTTTAIGALLGYISDPSRKHFQPMNINFGLIPAYVEQISAAKKKRGIGTDQLRLNISEQALRDVRAFFGQHGLGMRAAGVMNADG